MRSREAVAAALTILNRPQAARQARHCPLPKGVDFLLEIAAGDGEALRDASVITGRTEAALREAAGFFIEQVLLNQHIDNYRVFGVTHEASQSDLRRNMALIMRWLHSDGDLSGATVPNLDKRLYVNRVTAAWETIKTNERRVAYDAALATSKNGEGIRRNFRTFGERRRLEQPLKRRRFWSRILHFIALHP
jgi:hypothetical protein